MDEIIKLLTDNRAVFDAVDNGTAADDDCHTVQGIVAQVRGFLTDMDNRAGALPNRRAQYFALLPADKRVDAERAVLDTVSAVSVVAAVKGVSLP